MVSKCCDNCGKFFSNNTNLKNHLNRKNPCVSPDVSIFRLKFKCNRCYARFQSNQNLTTHLNRKTPCIVKKSEPEEIELRIMFEHLREDNEKIKIEVEQLRKQSSKPSNVNTTNHNINTINNITINSYGKEDMTHITDAMFKICFQHMQKSVETMFDMKHFSQKRQENSNMYITNLRDSYMMIYDAGKWNKVNKAMMLEKIYYTIKDELSDALGRMREDETIESRLEKIFQWFVEDDLGDEREARFKKVSFDKMACAAYNNRHFPMKIKNQMDKAIKNKENNN